MIKVLSVAIVAVLFFESDQQLIKLPNLLETNDEKGVDLLLPPLPALPGWPCYYPTHIQCWTEWFDRDDPSGTGDWETLSNLRKENPGKICPRPVDIEARTLSGLTAADAGDAIYKNDPTVGFVCRNQDQSKKRCNDYRVRFSCHPPFCGVCWTDWFDRDDPTGTGDWETLSDLQKENPKKICDHPLYIEAVTTDTMTPAVDTGDVFYAYNPTTGFICRKEDQENCKMCRDYKVRFGCPCYH